MKSPHEPVSALPDVYCTCSGEAKAAVAAVAAIDPLLGMIDVLSSVLAPLVIKRAWEPVAPHARAGAWGLLISTTAACNFEPSRGGSRS